ncbi:S8 family serine peptidase [Paenibacillus spiritus]|nr:S8 family serine peptidase [Paenibacillus spiritus]
MEWNKLPRKASILALSLGVTAGMIPGAAFAASSDSLQKQSLTQNSAAPYISPEINTKSSKDVRVIVQLSGQPAAVGKYAAKQGITALAKTATEASVKSQQSDVLDKADDKGIDLTVNYQYDTVLNGFEVTIPADEIPALAKIPGVASIYPNSTWYALPDQQTTVTEETYRNDIAPLQQIHATNAWDMGYTGKGLKIGVIDTGVDYTHPDLKDAYKGGYDSFYQDNDPYEEVPLTKDNDPYHVGYEGTYHGTHVAGTIVGQYKDSEIAQKGVAYGAELYAYKVLGRNLDDPSTSSGSSAQVIDGIEHAVKDNMDVINLSLGSDSEKDVNSPDSIAINNAVLSGVTAVIANGNNGPGYFTMGSPAVSQLGIAVGAVNSPVKQFSGTFKAAIAAKVTNATYATDYEFRLMGYELGNDDFTGILGTAPVRVVYADLGADDDYPKNADLSDAVVLISRGDLAFTDKIANAKKRNAKAVVIFNGNFKTVKPDPNNKDTWYNTADLSESIKDRDGFIGTTLGDGFDNIPTFDIKGSTGRQLARAILANPDKDVYFTFPNDYHPSMSAGDQITSFSSWGPNTDGKLSIKPDIVAPGDGILSTWPAYGKDHPEISYEHAYNRISGTSMATPHVAGLSLLLLQAHPEYSPLDVRAALANTSQALTYTEKGVVYPEDFYAQGPGRANVENAIKTPAILGAVEPITILDKNYQKQAITNFNPSTSFGTLTPSSSDSRTLQLQNKSDRSVAYSASIEWTYGGAGVEASLDAESVTASAYGTDDFNLNVQVAKDAEPGMYQGYVVLTSPGLPTLHLPFAISVDETTNQPDWGTGIQEPVLQNKVMYNNETNVLNFKIKAEDINYYEVDLVGLDDKTRGYFEVNSTGSPSQYFGPYTYSTVIGSTYYPYDEKGNPVLDASGAPVTAKLTAGEYKIQIVGIKAKDNTKLPVKIDLLNDDYYTAYTAFRYIDAANPNPTAPSTGGSSGGGTGGGAGSGTVTPAPAAPVPATAAAVVDADAKQAAVAPTVTSANGVSSVTVADTALTAALTAAGTGKTAVVITIPATTDKAATVNLTGDQVKKLAGLQTGSTVVVSVNGSAVALPVSLLTGTPAGASLKLDIKQAPEAAAKLTASVTGASVIGTPISFEAAWTTATGSTYLNTPVNVFIDRSFTVPGKVETGGVLFEEGGVVTPVASKFAPQSDGTTLVTVSRPGFSTYAAVSKPAAAFTDIASSPAADAIKKLSDKLIIQGTSATAFSPKSSLTRAEFTALLTRALGLRTDAKASFSDVKSTDWYAADVAAASKAGLILGVGGGKFAPTQKVSRQELAVILDRALKLTGTELKTNPSLSAYADSAKIAPYAKDSIQSLTAAGVISADQGTSFNPKASASRETAAAALYQLLSKAGLIN